MKGDFDTVNKRVNELSEELNKRGYVMHHVELERSHVKISPEAVTVSGCYTPGFDGFVMVVPLVYSPEYNMRVYFAKEYC